MAKLTTRAAVVRQRDATAGLAMDIEWVAGDFLTND
jgi:hypothetical protein